MKLINLVGKRFGKLTIVSYAREGRWNYVCDCGNKNSACGQDIREGKTKSCGCSSSNSGFEDKLLSSKRMLFSSYKFHAKSRNLYMLLSFEEFIEMIQKDCYYCGQEPYQYAKSALVKRRLIKGFLYNGIDRLDSTKGYDINNAVPCCKRCNVSKWDRNEIDFIRWVKRCYENIEKKGLF